MSYGEYIKKGTNKKEILLSTYICHPTMANNEGSGITILTYVAKYLSKLKTKFTYRIVYSPETIGSLAYLSKNYDHLKKNIVGGYVLTCIGDEKKFSLLKSRNKNSITDYAAEHVLNSENKRYNLFEWDQRGSDERQYCAPKIDLPISSIMRSKYLEYKEYHTSLDKLDKVVTAKGLRESYEYVVKIINLLEKSYYLISTFPGEPHLGKRNLYPNISVKNNKNLNRDLLNILTWSDGKTPTFEIMNKCNLTNKQFDYLLKILQQYRLVSKSEVPI